MNGEPLPLQHGYPLRLIVPSWYAVASVKWLTEIELIAQPFVGHYQTDKYWFEWERNRETVREPVTLQRVRALITGPSANQEVARRRCDDPRRSLVGCGSDRACRCERRRRKLAGGASDRRTQASQLAMVGIDRPRDEPGVVTCAHAPPISRAVANLSKRSGTAWATATTPFIRYRSESLELAQRRTSGSQCRFVSTLAHARMRERASMKLATIAGDPT